MQLPVEIAMTPKPSFAPVRNGLQRKCACGGTPGLSNLKVNEPGDIYEQEADRIADWVLAAPSHSEVGATRPRIQRFSGQSSGQMDPARTSVDVALASPGKPLEPALRQDMEQRFGYDFSRVRVHSGMAAAQSAQDVDAHAYTVGHDIVFDADRFAPGTHEGRRLIAHELTHTIQQSSYSPILDPSAATLQRSPQPLSELKPPPGSISPFITATLSDDTELYFGQRTDVCPTCHQPEEQSRFATRKVQHERVTESKILEWAATHVWGEALIDGKSLSKQRLFSLVQRREDKKLDAIWQSYRDQTVAKVSPNMFEDFRHPIFLGSDTARSHWAEYLRANWTNVSVYLDQRAIDRLVQEIDATLHSRVIPQGATLVTDPKAIAFIEDTPEQGSLGFGRDFVNVTVKVGFEWVGKRMKSVSSMSLSFEVLGHEGIYFDISPRDFQKTDPAVGKTMGEVAKGTEGIAVVGKFIKGFLNALASPVTIALDTGAKVLDMTTMAVSALAGKDWYTCLSSTCQQYEACLNSDKSADECKSDALEQALKEATIIIPLYQQGRECLGGGPDAAEACAAIAALGLGLVGERISRLSKHELEGVPAGGAKAEEAAAGVAKGRKPLTKAEFEEAAIRGAIDRPRAGDPSFAKALEKPKVPKAEKPPSSRMPQQPIGKGRPAAKAPKIVDPLLKKAIKSFAAKIKLAPDLLESEVVELREDAKDPGKVHRPKDLRYDAEIATADNHVTYKRERGTRFWDRCWNPCKPGAVVGPEVEASVDATLKRSEGKAEPPKAAEAEKTPSEEPPSKAEQSKAPPPVSAGSPYSHLSDTELVKRVAERTLDTSITGVKARLVTRSRILRARLRRVLLAEFGENALREHEFIVIGMSADKAGSFQLRSAGKVFAANDPVAAEIFAYRAVARTGKPGSAGGVLVVVERGAAKIPREVPIGDMPFVNQIILQGENLDRLSRASDVVALPEGFFDE
jgi:hypothetical protein